MEQFANKIIEQLSIVLKTKQIPRTSLRFVDGKPVTNNFTAPASKNGNLAKTLYTEVTDTHINIWGAGYIYTFVYGRGPTKKTGSGSVSKGIREWVRQRGITSDLKEDQLVYLITRKIHKHGNSIYLFSGRNDTGLLNNIITDTLKKEFNDNFTRDVGEQLVRDFAE
jgi:hypothetical protein